MIAHTGLQDYITAAVSGKTFRVTTFQLVFYLAVYMNYCVSTFQHVQGDHYRALANYFKLVLFIFKTN